MNLGDVGEFNGGRLYTGRTRLDYRYRLLAPTPALRAISTVAELLAEIWCSQGLLFVACCDHDL